MSELKKDCAIYDYCFMHDDVVILGVPTKDEDKVFRCPVRLSGQSEKCDNCEAYARKGTKEGKELENIASKMLGYNY